MLGLVPVSMLPLALVAVPVLGTEVAAVLTAVLASIVVSVVGVVACMVVVACVVVEESVVIGVWPSGSFFLPSSKATSKARPVALDTCESRRCDVAHAKTATMQPARRIPNVNKNLSLSWTVRRPGSCRALPDKYPQVATPS